MFQGGVHLTKDPAKVPELVTSMIGHRLITKQTPKDGIPVSKVSITVTNVTCLLYRVTNKAISRPNISCKLSRDIY